MLPRTSLMTLLNIKTLAQQAEGANLHSRFANSYWQDVQKSTW